MTFLELVQRACAESGTVPKAGPDSVSAAPGIMAKWVGWVRSAYMDIQTAESSWKWLRAEVEGTLFEGQNRFPPAAFGIADRFRSWRPRSDRGYPLWTTYDPDVGIKDEAELCLVEYDELSYAARGEAAPGRPWLVAEDDAGSLAVWPMPDKPYRVRLAYNRSPQVLRADLDTPEMPEHHHELIVYRALLKGLTYDEASVQFPVWQQDVERMMADLRDTQLPKPVWGGPLA